MISVAIDGPSGAGKSTIAKAIAQKKNYIYVDTGAMYRAIGLFMVRNGIDIKDNAKVASKLSEITLNLKYVNGEQRVYLNGDDVSTDIRLPEMSMAASGVSAIKEVRAFLLDVQRNFAKTSNIIMDGRDIGTVILPNADVKIFLTASSKKRAERRYKELLEKGIGTSYEEVFSDLIKRDENDINRPIAPLKQAKDAILVDSTNLTQQETINKIISIIGERTENVL